MRTLNELVIALEKVIDRQETVKAVVSNGSVGWHIEHCLLTINLIHYALQKAEAQKYQRKISLSKILILAVGRIPRGRAKAPKVVHPQIYDATTLREHIQKTKLTLEGLNHLHPKQYFSHPYFGDLQVQEAIKFLKIHTNHHLLIIQDILR